MDADRRPLRLLCLLAPLAAAAGCTNPFLSKPAPKLPGVIRSQAPDGPIVPPGPLTPPAVDPPTPPTPAPAAAPVTPAATVSTSAANAVVPAGGPTAEQAATQVRVVATVGSDIVITDDEVWQMVRQRMGEYVKLTGPERDARERGVFREELRKLIERELILADFLGKIKKTKPQVAVDLRDEAGKMAGKQMKAFKEANKFTSEADFTEVLRAQGLSMKGLKRQLERGAMVQIYLNQLMRDKGKTTSLAEVSGYYDGHPDEFKIEERIQWLDLFVSYGRFATPGEARQYADKLLAQARGGADFVGLVKSHGHGDSALRGGEGAGSKRGEIRPAEVEPAVLGTAAGQVSDLVPTETGFHIVKVLEREEAGTRPFEDRVQTYIRNKLAALAQKAEYERLIEELWRKTTVKVIELP